jgi:hypothetical protein
MPRPATPQPGQQRGGDQRHVALAPKASIRRVIAASTAAGGVRGQGGPGPRAFL